MEPAAARREALRRFGDPGRIARECRSIARTREAAERRAGLRHDLAQDLRWALRHLSREPAFTLAAVAILSLGIGASTGLFSVADVVVFRPLPYAEPGRLVWIDERTPEGDRFSVSLPNLLDWRRSSGAFSGIAGFQLRNASLDPAGGRRAGEGAGHAGERGLLRAARRPGTGGRPVPAGRLRAGRRRRPGGALRRALAAGLRGGPGRGRHHGAARRPADGRRRGAAPRSRLPGGGASSGRRCRRTAGSATTRRSRRSRGSRRGSRWRPRRPTWGVSPSGSARSTRTRTRAGGSSCGRSSTRSSGPRWSGRWRCSWGRSGFCC